MGDLESTSKAMGPIKRKLSEHNKTKRKNQRKKLGEQLWKTLQKFCVIY